MGASYYESRRRLGLCLCCGKKVTDGDNHAYCAECRAKKRLQRREAMLGKPKKKPGRKPKGWKKEEEQLAELFTHKDVMFNGTRLMQEEYEVETLDDSAQLVRDVADLFFYGDIVIVYSVHEDGYKSHVFSGRLPKDKDTLLHWFGGRKCLGVRVFQQAFIIYISGVDMDKLREAVIL